MKGSVKKILRILIVAVIIAFLAVAGLQYFSLREKNQALREKKEQLQALIEEESKRAEELEDEEEYIKTIEYIEERARAIGYVYPDEIIFKKDE